MKTLLSIAAVAGAMFAAAWFVSWLGTPPPEPHEPQVLPKEVRVADRPVDTVDTVYISDLWALRLSQSSPDSTLYITKDVPAKPSVWATYVLPVVVGLVALVAALVAILLIGLPIRAIWFRDEPLWMVVIYGAAAIFCAMAGFLLIAGFYLTGDHLLIIWGIRF